MGWNKQDKLDEMDDPDLVYFAIRDEQTKLLAFVSYMHTTEDDREVVYLYELQVIKESQGKKLGKQLMDIVIEESLTTHKPIMLTVFLMNSRAIAFYAKLGFLGSEPEVAAGKRVLGWMQMERSHVEQT